MSKSTVPDPSTLLTRPAAAAWLKWHITTLDRKTAAGQVPYYRLGGRVLYDPTDLRSLVASARVPAADR